MSLKEPRKGDLQKVVPQFKLGKRLGAGGNAVVYEAKDDGERVALKFLLNPDTKRYCRFRDEVLVVTTTLKGSEHVIPITDSFLPGDPDTGIPWYAMPIVTPLRKNLEYASTYEVVSALTVLAAGLASLHDMDVAHRDIKPENLFVFELR